MRWNRSRAASFRYLPRTTSFVRASVLLALSSLLLGSGLAADEILQPVLPAVRLPATRAAVKGFTVTVKFGAQDIAGYVPVQCTFTSTSRFPADREFQLLLAPIDGDRIPADRGLIVELPIKVAEGVQSVTVTRYVPKWSAGNGYQVQLYEAGTLLKEYDGVAGYPVVQAGRLRASVLARECRPDWLVIDPRPELDEQQRQQVMSQFSAAVDAAPVSSGPLGTTGGLAIEATGQDALPTDWRGYQRYDVVLLSRRSLQELVKRQTQFQTLRQWLLVGGVVLAYDGDSPSDLIEQMGFAWTDADQSRELVSKYVSMWIDADRFESDARRQQISALESALTEGGDSSELSVIGSDQSTGDPGTGVTRTEFLNEQLRELRDLDASFAELRENNPWLKLTRAQWTERVRVQSAGGGIIVVVDGDLADAPKRLWDVLHPIVGYRISPTLRRGVDPLLGDSRFMQWMIPGVAQPPVYTFMGLLTAFVILVGPVAYRRTTRYGRGYLMFAIAPLLALMTTLAMFGYGIVADGFGTVTRIRQLTWVDGASGDAGERARSTYFAGVRPGGGLSFPGDMEVIGYPQSFGRALEDLDEIPFGHLGRVTVTDNEQRFENTFLPSRQQRQFVVHRPLEDFGAIELQALEDGTRKLSSTLDFELERVVACDENANYWLVDGLPAEQTRPAISLPVRDASRMLGAMYNDYRPVSAVREASDRSGYQRKVRDLQTAINRTIGDGSTMVTDGIFERWLREHLQLRGGIPRGYFVAVADVSGDMLAVEGSEAVESVRYLFGTLR